MKTLFLLAVTLMLLSLNAYSQIECGAGQFNGCGSFNFQGVQRTICGCFGQISTPDDGSITLKSCSKECAYDGRRTEDGCRCLRGPVEIPGLLSPQLPTNELPALADLKLKDPNLYQIYIDTQLGGDNIRAPMPIKEFREAFK